MSTTKVQEDYRWLADRPQGKRILADLKGQFGTAILATKDPHQTTVRAAQRDVVDYVESMMGVRSE